MRHSFIGVAILASILAASGFARAQEPGAFDQKPEAEEPCPPTTMHTSDGVGAFDGVEREPSEWSPSWQFGFDYRMYWVKGGDMPPLLTTGNLSDAVPGALGQPGTQVLFGGHSSDLPPLSGLGLKSTLWLAEHQLVGLEGQFFVTEQRTRLLDYVTPGTANDIYLARPFINAPFSLEDADPRIIPGATAGEVSSAFLTHLYGGELNFAYNSTQSLAYSNLYLLAGVRYVRLDEKILLNDTIIDLESGGGTTGSFTKFKDNFTTYNNIYVGQIGGRLNTRWENTALDIFMKLGYGRNEQTLKISGFTQINDTLSGVSVIDNDQGLYAQPTNVGVHRHHSNVFMPEVGFNLSYDWSERIRLGFGYDFMEITGVLRAGDQIDRSITIQPVNAPFLVQPNEPLVHIHTTSYWIQSINFSVEFIF